MRKSPINKDYYIYIKSKGYNRSRQDNSTRRPRCIKIK